jgi:phage-related protein
MKMLPSLAGMAGKFLPAITGLASRAVPMVSKAIAVGKNIVPKVLGAVGKVQNAINTAKAVGKVAKGAVDTVAPEIGKKIDDAYNRKIVGGMSVGDVLEKGEKGLAQASGVANQAKAILANVAPQ